MRSNQAFCILFFIMFVVNASAQGPRQIKNRLIREVVTKTLDDRKAQSSLEWVISRYDRKGNLLEIIKLNEDSSVTEWEQFGYHKNGLTHFHNELNPATGAIQKSTIYTYDKWKNEILEEIKDASGKLMQKSESEYDKFGQKFKEITVDGNGLLIRTTLYSYDSKGMLLCRKIFDASEKLIYEKCNTYSY